MAVLSLPVVLLERALAPDGGVAAARGVVFERRLRWRCCRLPVVLLKSALDSAGGVGAARGVAKERLDSAGGVVQLPVVLLRSALIPLAVLSCPWCC